MRKSSFSHSFKKFKILQKQENKKLQKDILQNIFNVENFKTLCVFYWLNK